MNTANTPRPAWRRRVGFYFLVAAGALLLVHFLENKPQDVRLVFALDNVEFEGSSKTRLDRDEIVGLNVEVRQDEDSLARSTMTFAPSKAPIRTAPIVLPLRKGDYEAHVRLTFADGSERPVFRLLLNFSVGGGDGDKPVVLELR